MSKANKVLTNTCDCHGTDKKPLSRTEFRELCLIRDGHKCLFCDETENLSVHHIVERRLFGACLGQHLDNGATVCEFHHMFCERTIISCDQVRDKAGINNIVLPELFYPDHQYDKWGNIIYANGMRRSIGPLFYDESVQKVLKDGGVLNQFSPWIKYPRTVHHPLSLHKTSDDKINYNFANEILSNTKGNIVITIKMDGENFTGYTDYCHARSLDSGNHESRTWAKTYHFNNVSYNLPEGMRYCAENLYAKHAIKYDNLKSYLLAFQIWDKLECLSWSDTKLWFELLNLDSVQELYHGPYDEVIINDLFKQVIAQDHEGIVIRSDEAFHYQDFHKRVCKLVRPDFLAGGGQHWRFKKIEVNGLK